MKKILGIIGGFGPETTAQFQLAIIEMCRINGSCVRPEILMWNAPIPLALEENLILHNSDIQKFLPFLIQGAKLLEKAGATVLVLPCNTLHIFINEIRANVHIPVLSIVEKTQEHLINRGARRVAIFGTTTILDANIYQQTLKSQKIIPIFPTNHEQDAIDQVIFDVLNCKAHRRATRVLEHIAIDCIRRGATDILLACTDLHIVFPKLREASVHDTMHILADACVREILE